MIGAQVGDECLQLGREPSGSNRRHPGHSEPNLSSLLPAIHSSGRCIDVIDRLWDEAAIRSVATERLIMPLPAGRLAL